MTGIHTLISGYGGTGGTEIQYDLNTTPYHPLTECKQVILMEKKTMVLKTMVPLPEISGHGYFHKNI